MKPVIVSIAPRIDRYDGHVVPDVVEVLVNGEFFDTVAFWHGVGWGHACGRKHKTAAAAAKHLVALQLGDDAHIRVMG